MFVTQSILESTVRLLVIVRNLKYVTKRLVFAQDPVLGNIWDQIVNRVSALKMNDHFSLLKKTLINPKIIKWFISIYSIIM